MSSDMTIPQAKVHLRRQLETLRLPYTKLRAHTVSFSDLARGQGIFITVLGSSTWTFEQRNRFYSDDAKAERRGHYIADAEGGIVS